MYLLPRNVISASLELRHIQTGGQTDLKWITVVVKFLRQSVSALKKQQAAAVVGRVSIYGMFFSIFYRMGHLEVSSHETIEDHIEEVISILNEMIEKFEKVRHASVIADLQVLINFCEYFSEGLALAMNKRVLHFTTSQRALA